MSTEENLFFMTWNIKGLKTNANNVKTKIENQNCHVAFIQETHISKDEGSNFEQFDNWRSVFTAYDSRSRGVAILIKKDLLGNSEIQEHKDPTGCYTVVKCTLKGQLFTLVSVYTDQKDATPLKRLTILLENFAEGILLIGGDFNVSLNPFLDKNSLTENSLHASLKPYVEEFMTSFHLVDVWRRFHPKDTKYSFSTKTETKKIKSRLDYFFVTEETLQYVENCEIFKIKSHLDHHPLVLKFRMCKNQNEQSDFSKAFSQMHLSDPLKTVADMWLGYKKHLGLTLDLSVNLDTPPMISVREIDSAIQSLILNENQHPDGILLSFYKRYSYILIPYLTVYYHNILKSKNISDVFKASTVNQTYNIFNVDYLILATVMARWLKNHLELHSSYYPKKNKIKIKTKAMFAFENQYLSVSWTTLKMLLEKEQDAEKTHPPLTDKFKISILDKILTNRDRDIKLLGRGCPLTPVLMTLRLKHVPNEISKDTVSSIHIYNENVVACFSEDFHKYLTFQKLEDLEVEGICIYEIVYDQDVVKSIDKVNHLNLRLSLKRRVLRFISCSDSDRCKMAATEH